jgi:aminoglycoside 6-adenylyltransferase
MWDEAAYEKLIGNFVLWASSCRDIRSAIIVGSRARIDHPADQLADLDILIYADAFEHYLSEISWLNNVGDVWIAMNSRTAGNDPELLVMFEDGYNVDFVFLSSDILRRMANSGSLSTVFRRGSRVILDKDGVAAKVIPSSFGVPPYQPPTQEDFMRVVSAFWYTAFYVAKQLCREELWMVKLRDANMKQALLRMLEWHAHATKRTDCDTWYAGRFLKEWADPRAQEALNEVFSHFDKSDSWRGLFATARLFTWLATETADHLGYEYPAIIDERVTKLITALYGHQ